MDALQALYKLVPHIQNLMPLVANLNIQEIVQKFIPEVVENMLKVFAENFGLDSSELLEHAFGIRKEVRDMEANEIQKKHRNQMVDSSAWPFCIMQNTTIMIQEVCDITQAEAARSLESCALLCLAEQCCTRWEFNLADGRCSLSAAVKPFFRNDEFVAVGVKNCIPPAMSPSSWPSSDSDTCSPSSASKMEFIAALRVNNASGAMDLIRNMDACAIQPLEDVLASQLHGAEDNSKLSTAHLIMAWAHLHRQLGMVCAGPNLVLTISNLTAAIEQGAGLNAQGVAHALAKVTVLCGTRSITMAQNSISIPMSAPTCRWLAQLDDALPGSTLSAVLLTANTEHAAIAHFNSMPQELGMHYLAIPGLHQHSANQAQTSVREINPLQIATASPSHIVQALVNSALWFHIAWMTNRTEAVGGNLLMQAHMMVVNSRNHLPVSVRIYVLRLASNMVADVAFVSPATAEKFLQDWGTEIAELSTLIPFAPDQHVLVSDSAKRSAVWQLVEEFYVKYLILEMQQHEGGEWPVPEYYIKYRHYLAVLRRRLPTMQILSAKTDALDAFMKHVDEQLHYDWQDLLENTLRAPFLATVSVGGVEHLDATSLKETSEMSIVGFEVDKTNGAIHFLMGKPGESHLTSSDVAALLQFPHHGRIFFTLEDVCADDRNQCAHMPFFPLQQAVSNVEPYTPLWDTLFWTDTILKNFGLGLTYSLDAPFMSKQLDNKTLPQWLLDKLRPVHQRGWSTSSHNRFWIQSPVIDYAEEDLGDRHTFVVAGCRMTVATHGLTLDSRGTSRDTAAQPDPNSPESLFAREFSELRGLVKDHVPWMQKLEETCTFDRVLKLMDNYVRELVDTGHPLAEHVLNEVNRLLSNRDEEQVDFRRITRIFTPSASLSGIKGAYYNWTGMIHGGVNLRGVMSKMGAMPSWAKYLRRSPLGLFADILFFEHTKNKGDRDGKGKRWDRHSGATWPKRDCPGCGNSWTGRDRTCPECGNKGPKGQKSSRR